MELNSLFQSTIDVYTAQRSTEAESGRPASERVYDIVSAVRGENLRSKEPVVYLPDSGQVVRAIPAWKAPKEVQPEGTDWGSSKIEL